MKKQTGAEVGTGTRTEELLNREGVWSQGNHCGTGLSEGKGGLRVAVKLEEGIEEA